MSLLAPVLALIILSQRLSQIRGFLLINSLLPRLNTNYIHISVPVSLTSPLLELQQQLLESEPSCRYETNRSTYITKLPTPKVFLKSIINRSGNLFEQLSPSNLDPRYTTVPAFSKSIYQTIF